MKKFKKKWYINQRRNEEKMKERTKYNREKKQRFAREINKETK
jgi:hypothetical protein